MKLKSFAQQLTPPIIWRQLSKIAHRHEMHPDFLFDNLAISFKKSVLASKCYMEYGIGKSTIWAYNNSKTKILGVDSSAIWVDHVLRECPDLERLHLMHVDLGPLGDWGRPLTLFKKENIIDYIDSHWNSSYSDEIDMVLIDGRFRISCFYSSLAKAKPGCIIFFDDYIMRPLYSEVENDLKPTAVEGRQAIFIVPELTEDQKSEMQNKAECFKFIFD
jgi:hypothetical protein